MSYAQTNYKDKVGDSNLTIAEIGCFVTADCNLLLDAGILVDPATLNVFYKNNNLYTFDLADKANDDITWSTVTHYNGGMVAKTPVYGGWPSTNLAIVKFMYRNHSGTLSTHFCKVADWQNHLILDSWDGKVKSPGSYYGEPVAYCEYEYTAPVAQTAVYTPAPTSRYVVLPAHVASWAVYKVGSGLRKGTEDQVGALLPAKYNGLEYQIVQWVGDYAVVIDTQSYGRVTIWVKETDAQFKDEPTPPVAVAAAAPVAPVAPKPVYERLASAMNVQTKPNVRLWDLGFTDYADAEKNHIVTTIAEPTKFQAVGKATRADLPDKPVYFMSAESFGAADITGIPTYNQGINTVDLQPAAAEQVEATAAAEVLSQEDHIDVKVMPHTPDSWKRMDTSEHGDYVSQTSLIVHDLEGKLPDSQLAKGQVVHIAGKFKGPDGIWYWRTIKSASTVDPKTLAPKNEDWKGIPLKDEADNDVLKEDETIFGYLDDAVQEFKDGIGQISNRRKAIIKAANVDDKVKWLTSSLRKKGKK